MPVPNADDFSRTIDPAPSVATPGTGTTADFAQDSISVNGGTGSEMTGEATEATSAESVIAEPERASGSVTVPGYEIEGVLGRGGMGVVYKARHLALKRPVALKMMLAGGHAGPRELARFRIEAEAVARLQHPNIVQIHEVGEADGHPYCALEFVEGGNLARKLDGKPMPARESARLVETVARATQLAHSRNVVHRDLKPANILLTADGTPRITDFGLARQLDSDSGETQAGAVMGTPSYMAPEQASGRAHEAGPAADIYALGAILYACLTGRPPFQGRTTVETLDQVRTQEPVPPSHWRAGVPLDLETVCLKCLRKEPEKRYPSAAELADELVRFLQGEPVQARPVSRVERGWRWCRRNPALASALGTVVAVLVAASIVSTLFWIDAHNKEKALETKNTELEQSQSVIVKKNAELEQRQDQLEGALARTKLSPLGEAPGPLTDAEVHAFTEVAAFDNERLTERFVTEVLSNRQGIRKLRARAAFALQSLVGLDARKRQDVERRLLLALEERDLADESRTDLALAMSALGELSPPAAAVVAQTLLQALARTNDPIALQSQAQALSAMAIRRESREAAATLTEAMTRTREPGALQELARGLSIVAPRLEASDAATAAATLTQVIAKTDEPGTLRYLAQGLSAVAPQLEAREAAGAAATLTQAMTRTNDFLALASLAQCLSAVAARMEAGEAAAILTGVLNETNNPVTAGALAPGLSAVAARLEAQEAAKVAATLTRRVLKMVKSPAALGPMAQSLTAVVVRLEPQEAAKAADLLIQAMLGTNDPESLRVLAQCLVSLAARLERDKASRVSVRTIAALVAKANDPYAPPALAQCLSVVAARLEPKDAAQAAIMLSQAMNTRVSHILAALAPGLAAVAARMEPKEAAATLTQTMTRTRDRAALESLAMGLAGVVAPLEPKEGARVYTEAAATLTKAMTNTKDPTDLSFLAMGLSAVSASMEPREAAATLTQALTNTIDPFAPRELGRGLAAAADRLEPKEAAAMLTQAIAKTNDPGALQFLKQGQSAVAARLIPKEAPSASAQVATLTQAMNKTNDWMPLRDSAKSVAELAPRLEPREAEEAADTLIQAMTRTNNPYALWSLARGVSALAARLQPREAARVSALPFATLTQAMSTTNDPTAVSFLAEGLSALLGDGRRIERAAAMAATIGSLHEGQGLPGVLALLRPATDPFPHRLSDQESVELLKRPLCVGPARRAILDHLEYRYQRTFADQWDFVRFAEEQKLGLDFTSPLSGRPRGGALTN